MLEHFRGAIMFEVRVIRRSSPLWVAGVSSARGTPAAVTAHVEQHVSLVSGGSLGCLPCVDGRGGRCAACFAGPRGEGPTFTRQYALDALPPQPHPSPLERIHLQTRDAFLGLLGVVATACLMGPSGEGLTLTPRHALHALAPGTP